MEMFEACEAFSSLAQETRLRAFKLLMEYGSSGAPAGQLADELKIPDNTLSFHLSHMSKAGLVSSKKDGRSVIYQANTALMNNLVSFLIENCCAREGEKSCNPPKKKVKRC
jgi:ArsR family transcriptional regulator, arsenate/arsenite/antimonite-responsive transcriptional repressor